MRDLSRLLRPKSIAVIGGGSWCQNVVSECRKLGYAGDIWPVNPSRDSIAGVKAFPSVTALPSPPDASFVGVNRHATTEVVAQLSAQGAGGAVCFAAGFSEAERELEDGRQLQAALVSVAGDMPVLGPNCYGLINCLDRVAIWPDQHGARPVENGVAIIAQSSNIAINLTMQRRGLPIAYVVTVGNQAQLGFADIGQALLADDRVTALGLHIEGIGDLRALEALSETARSLNKPVVALRVGRSSEAKSALISHSASLAGTEAGAHALFRRLGIGEVRTLSTFLETLKLLHVAGPLSSCDVISMSCSGGEASLVADTGLAAGVRFPPLTETQLRGLREVLGPATALSNPLDYQTHIWGNVAAMTQAFRAALSNSPALGMIVLDIPRADRCDPDAWLPVLTSAEAVTADLKRPLAIVSTLTETMPEDMALSCMARGLVPLNGLPEALEAVSTAAGLSVARPAPPLLIPGPEQVTKTIPEHSAKQELAKFGLTVPPSALASTAEDAVKIAEALGFPVVLKTTQHAHKTEQGGVALDLEDDVAVRDAFERMPGDRILVEGMVKGALVELLVGVTCDPAHGFVLTIAAGGTLTELVQDSASLLVPASDADITDALKGLSIAPLFDGYRGAPAVDWLALVQAIMGVQAYVNAVQPKEVEINPLICTMSDAWVADALIVRGETDV
ncbi:MAG: acetate--CoA ligase family protein [Pseudomonadota bacterium]